METLRQLSQTTILSIHRRSSVILQHRTVSPEDCGVSSGGCIDHPCLAHAGVVPYNYGHIGAPSRIDSEPTDRSTTRSQNDGLSCQEKV